MTKVIIYIQDDGNIDITYDIDKLVYPICEIQPNKITISEVTHNEVITLISNFLYKVGTVLRREVINQEIANKPLNKPTEKK